MVAEVGDDLGALVAHAIATNKAQPDGGDGDQFAIAMTFVAHGLESLRRIAVALETANG